MSLFPVQAQINLKHILPMKIIAHNVLEIGKKLNILINFGLIEIMIYCVGQCSETNVTTYSIMMIPSCYKQEN